MGYLFLCGAIVAEVIGTSALKASDGFTRIGPSVIVLLGYGLSFYFLSLVLKTIPVGIAYAIWAGLGIVLIAGVSALLYRQIPDTAAMIGMGLILTGVVIIHLFSNTTSH